MIQMLVKAPTSSHCATMMTDRSVLLVCACVCVLILTPSDSMQSEKACPRDHMAAVCNCNCSACMADSITTSQLSVNQALQQQQQ